MPGLAGDGQMKFCMSAPTLGPFLIACCRLLTATTGRYRVVFRWVVEGLTGEDGQALVIHKQLLTK